MFCRLLLFGRPFVTIILGRYSKTQFHSSSPKKKKVIDPWGALLVGFFAGVLSVVGYVYITPYLERKIGLSDTCGVHNLHGMPGVMGGIGGVISAAVAGEAKYGTTIGTIFPARNPVEIEGGLGWDASQQAKHQLYALLTTLAMAIVAGLITGALVNLGGKFDPEKWYNDADYWHMPDEDEDVEAGHGDEQHHRHHNHGDDGGAYVRGSSSNAYAAKAPVYNANASVITPV